jgi:hypothetical protein
VGALIAYSGTSQQVDARLRMLNFRAECILELLGMINNTLFVLFLQGQNLQATALECDFVKGIPKLRIAIFGPLLKLNVICYFEFDESKQSHTLLLFLGPKSSTHSFGIIPE